MRRFPFFHHLHNITNLPKAGLDASLHDRGHAVRTADLHEVMVHRVKGEGVHVVLDLLAESLSETRVTLAVLANDAVVAFDV